MYALTEKGREHLKDLSINYSGLDKAEYNNICLLWSNFMGGRTTMSDVPNGIDALNTDDDNKFSALVIENIDESLKELKEKLQKLVGGSIRYKKIYVVTFNEHRKSLLPDSIDGVEIEIFKI